MSQGPEERGVGITLTEPLPGPPQEVFHYATGPVTYRHFVRNGQSWLAVYKAKHDGAGWLVVEASCRPLVLLAGDHVHCRFTLIEDRGPTVVVETRRGGMSREIEIDRDQVVFLDEAPAAAAAPPPR